MTDPKPKLYLIPGLGADHRLFQYLRLPSFDVECIDWLEPEHKENFNSYLDRLSGKIDTSKPFYLGGVSLGGIAAVEIARKLKPKNLLLISTAKTHEEMPKMIKLIGYLRLHRLMGKNSLLKAAELGEQFFMKRTIEHRELFFEMIKDSTERFLQFGCKSVVHWRNTVVPENYLHIHGKNDLIFPYTLIKNAYPIIGGTHFMVVEKAEEISAIIEEKLPIRG